MTAIGASVWFVGFVLARAMFARPAKYDPMRPGRFAFVRAGGKAVEWWAAT